MCSTHSLRPSGHVSVFSIPRGAHPRGALYDWIYPIIQKNLRFSDETQVYFTLIKTLLIARQRNLIKLLNKVKVKVCKKEIYKSTHFCLLQDFICVHYSTLIFIVNSFSLFFYHFNLIKFLFYYTKQFNAFAPLLRFQLHISRL